MRKVLLVVVGLVTAVLIAPAGATESDPFPAGACVRSTLVDPRPVCVLIDPTD